MRRRRLVLIGLSFGLLALLSWWAGAWRAGRNATHSAGTLVDPEAIELLERQSRGMLDSTEQRILLERLLTSGQPKLAQYVLEDELSKGPLPINHRLLLMDLLRINGDAAGARQQLTQLFRLHPNHPDLLVADVLLKHHSGQKAASLNQLQERFSTTALKDRVDLGLLLADLQRQSGRPGSAATLYLQLAAEDPGDARPLIALAMLRQEQGKPDEVRLLLNKARLRRAGPGQDDPLIDELSFRWGLRAAQVRAVQATGKAPSDTP